MKHLTRLLLLILILLNGAMFCFAQGSKESSEPPPASLTGYNPEAWKEFSSAEGRFSALFPGIPEEVIQRLPLPNENIVLHSYYLRTSVEYQTSYTDYPLPIEGTDKIAMFLNNVRDSSIKGINGKLLEDKESTFNGHPGRIYKVEFGGGYIINSRIFVVKNRFYMVATTTYGKKAPANVSRLYENAATTFLDSFKLLTSQSAIEQAAKGAAMTDSVGTRTEEGEVDRFLKQNNRKDIVLGRCLEASKCKSIKGIMADGNVIKGDVTAGEIINEPQPRYPAIAKAARQSGTVVVAVIVDEEGKVIAAQIQSGPPLLRVAALNAAREARFAPTLLDGKPVKVSGVITYNFSLKP